MSHLLQVSQKCVHLQCVFHSIRFKVNKGWSTAVLLFLCLYLNSPLLLHIKNIREIDNTPGCSLKKLL